MISQNNGNTENLRKALEQEFMKRLGGIEDAPEEVKFPVSLSEELPLLILNIFLISFPFRF